MNCLHCAKNISVLANICPHCHSETGTSKVYHKECGEAGLVAFAVFVGLCFFKFWIALIVASILAAWLAPERPVPESSARDVRIIG
jgi:uncharacterized membrane protein